LFQLPGTVLSVESVPLKTCCTCRTRHFGIQPSHVSRQCQQLQQSSEPTVKCYWDSWCW